MTDRYDIIVVGGGHAGCEAAFAAARMGASVLLLAIDKDAIGSMSCNPAIGGVGKGHLVREVDVFGGLIGASADDAAIHYRMLNASKGRAVHGPRIQADRFLFRRSVQARLARQSNLVVAEGEVVQLSRSRAGAVVGVQLQDGSEIKARAVVLATGTFLGGKLFRGKERLDGGRYGERPAHRLAAQLREWGLPIARMKTGTPPRLDGRTIDWAQVGRQDSDNFSWTMSAWSTGRINPTLFCGIVRTTPTTHDIIRNAFSESPLVGGVIEGRGPRYCPSIEDKVTRFGDRDGHQIFLEPETLSADVIYPNGISTSLAAKAQSDFVRSIPGLERTAIVQPGYAVEYDHVDPRILSRDLALSDMPGLYLAGQINGTTGYEEAAAQGLVVGLASASDITGRPKVHFDRGSSYIGVLVDDLTLQGVTEPYRMLTSRAESRLYLRADNAEARLGQHALSLGLLDYRQVEAYLARSEMRKEATMALNRSEYLDHNSTTISDKISDEIVAEVLADRLYAPYVARQARENERAQAIDRAIPDDFNYRSISGLSAEMLERLIGARPSSLAEAARIRGITPAALALLALATHRRAA